MARTGRTRAFGTALALAGLVAAPARGGGLDVTVTGSPVEGQTLTMTTDPSIEPVVAYAWDRCPQGLTCPDFLSAGQAPWVTIPGATASSYTLTGADVGTYIRAVAHQGTARPAPRRGGPTVPHTSPRLGPIQPAGSPPPIDTLPPPVVHETANVAPIEGVVYIRAPGSPTFRRLESAEQIPLGSTLDATDGEVAVVTARDTSGSEQTGWFWAGAFVLNQTGGDRPVTTFTLAGPFENAAARIAARGGDGSRRLWGRGGCKCRTEGRNSSGTARGTKWLTIDRRRTTVTRVKRGSVRVRDFVADRTVTVKAGESYTAGPGGGGRD